MKKIKLYINAFSPPIIWAAIIFLFSSQSNLPGFEQSAYDFVLKKIAHIFVYFVLYFLIKRAFDIISKKSTIYNQIYFPILICFLYAISDELHQSLIPGRYATIRDVGYDMFGIGLAFLKKFDFI